MMHSRLDHTISTGVLLALSLVLSIGCGADAGASFSSGGTSEGDFARALEALAEHRVREAHDTYTSLLERSTGDGRAAAGKAVTDLMLLPSSAPANELWTEHLGASGELDIVEVFYADEGYLYWLSRGVRWDGDGDYAGIRQLLVDRLPWSEEQLDSREAFVEGRTRPVGEAIETIERLTTRLERIESTIDLVLADDDFDVFILPGQALQEESLTLRLGPSEFALLGAAVAASRAVLRFASAYVYDWTLRQAFGSRWQQKAEADGGDHPEWEAWDYTIDYLDARLGRQLREQSDRHLTAAREASSRAISYLTTSIDRGRTQRFEGALRWSEVDLDYVRRLRDVLAAVREALRESTDIPSTDPSVRLDLSVFFESGRTLDSEIDWWRAESQNREPNDTDGMASETNVQWRWNERALQQWAVEGVVDPSFDVGSDDTPELTIGGDAWNNFRSTLVGPTRRAFEDAFFRSR